MSFPQNAIQAKITAQIPTVGITIPLDLYDYQNQGFIQTSRYINPITRDFNVSSDGYTLEGMNFVEQGVILAITTTINSSAVQSFGQGFTSIKLITPQINSIVANTLNNALAPLVNANLIKITSFSVINNQYGQLQVSFVYTNNTVGTSNPITFAIGI
jgi:hypothetical protein